MSQSTSCVTLAGCMAVCLLALVAGIAGHAQVSPGATATPVSVADSSCGRCHAKILNSYLATPMANASGLATERSKTGALQHQPSGIQYNVSLDGPQLVLTYQDAKHPEVAASRKLAYFLGSGHLGLTYLYSLNSYLFESPVAFYNASQGFDMKPGLESLTQAPAALPVQPECLRCHMSGVQSSDDGTVNRYSGLPFLHGGITCESCHGDTRSHVATAGKAAVVNPSRLDAERRDSICIRCHLEGDISVQRVGHSALDFQPGDSISDYTAYFVYGGRDATRRGVSEVEQLSVSMCKRSSGDKMSCERCHDPHSTPKAGEQAMYYRNKCLACHTNAAFAVTHHPENPSCISCHMPRAGAENIPHVAWTDHRILKYPEAPAREAIAASGEKLLPVFSPRVTSRDVGLAYYKAVLDGNSAAQQTAYDQLEALKPDLGEDKEALAALGILSEERGDYGQARELFQAVLKLDARNLNAISNLGTLLARAGDLQAAIALWRPAFKRNQDVVGLAKNLALVECAAGDAVAARATLQTTLQYSPGLADVLQLMSSMHECPK